MQGVRLRDETGQVILEPTDTTTSLMGTLVVPQGSPGNTPIRYTVTAPPGVNFIESNPFVFMLGCKKAYESTFYTQGPLVYQGWTKSIQWPWAPILFYGIINVTETTYEIYATPMIGTTVAEDMVIYYGYS